MNKLVIVESPTKAKTLTKFLGKEYEVKSSKGHIRDLPKSELGVDVEHEFKPNYVIMPGKNKVVNELKKAARDASEIYLATDLDREGEAIAYHLSELIGSKSKVLPAQAGKSQKSKMKRVVFHEITKDAILGAFKNPRILDYDLIDAYQARRVLDRLVGYKLSPLLWKKIRYGLSAGRVQSVAVRLIVERERERERFKSENYWIVTAELQQSAISFEAELISKENKPYEITSKIPLFIGEYQNKKTSIVSKKQVDEIIHDIKNHNFIVSEIEKKEVKRNPYPPFTTASLQRTAANYLGFSAKRTMRAAQSLYEEGYITYHRTDSCNLAEDFLAKCREYLEKEFGEQFVPKTANRYQTKVKSAQEAHEAIRPTSVGQIRNPKSEIRNKLGNDEMKLYELIWKRALASQMMPAIFDQVRVDIAVGPYLFRTTGRTVKFLGWMILQNEKLKIKNEKSEKERGGSIPELRVGEKLELLQLISSEHTTQPPPRYTEGSLIHDLEKNGIGRPSTYAPTITTIQERNYVVKDGNCFEPEDIGVVVNDLLVEHFPKIVDLGFTARMEDELDGIAKGEKKWVPVIREFYGPFSRELKSKAVELKKSDFTVTGKLSEQCPECGKQLVIKLSRYGKFISCSAFPDCKYGRPFEDKNHNGAADKIDEKQLRGKCLKCGGELVLKEGKFGKFIACSNYPKCKYTKQYLDKIGLFCPECGKGEIVIKRTKRGKIFYGCSRYPECKWASWEKPRQK